MELISTLKNTYNQLRFDNLDKLDDIYTEDIVFIDPFHRIEGLRSLKKHFENMYQKLLSSHFDYIESIENDKNAMLIWKMDYAHRSIGNGKLISICGSTHIKFDNKIFFHQDYFDASAMIYEHLPIIGSALKWIKKRL